jgi:hypothetical protein
MASDTGDRMKVVIYYAVWATLCAALAGAAISLIHTWFFSYNPEKSWLVHTLVSDLLTAALLAAGQGAVALVTGSVLAQLGRGLHGTVLLGLLIGAFDFVMDFVQMALPATELGWVPDLLILAGVTAGITALGSRASAA